MRNLEEEGKFIFFATRNGTVKKTPLKDFCNVMARGIIAIGIDKDDELIGAASRMATRSSFWPRMTAWRFASTRTMCAPWAGRLMACAASIWEGRLCGGSRGDSEGTEENGNGGHIARLILSMTEQGFGKRTDVDEYRLQSRGGKGVINVKTTTRNGKVSAIQLVDDSSELMVISQYGRSSASTPRRCARRAVRRRV